MTDRICRTDLDDLNYAKCKNMISLFLNAGSWFAACISHRINFKNYYDLSVKALNLYNISPSHTFEAILALISKSSVFLSCRAGIGTKVWQGDICNIITLFKTIKNTRLENIYYKTLHNSCLTNIQKSSFFDDIISIGESPQVICLENNGQKILLCSIHISVTIL